MNTLLKAALVAVPALAAAGTAANAAACTTKFLRGVWVGHASTEVDLYCVLNLNTSGRTTKSSCFNPKTLKQAATLDGIVKVTKSCDVTASFDFTNAATGRVSPATFTGKMNPKQGRLTGDFVIFGEGEAYRFIQQWN